MQSAAQAQLAPRAPAWIQNRWMDIAVGCGGWSAPLLLVGYLVGSGHVNEWSAAFYGLALFFNYPHYMATIYRAYHTAEDFQKYRIFTVHMTALVMLTVLVLHFQPGAIPWVFTLYLTWSPWHYSGQNYGIAMMFARRNGAQPAKRERNAIYAAFLFSYAGLVLSMHSGRSTDPLFLSLGINERVAHWALGIMSAAFVAAACMGFAGPVRRVGILAMLAPVTLLSTQFIWFLLPSLLSLSSSLEVPRTRYSTGILAVMHAAQYLWITSYYAKREAQGQSAGWRPWAYFATLLAGGIALFVPGPWIASYFFHYDMTASFLIFTALVNLHHFILDGAIWKLRDGRVANLLLNAPANIGNAAADVSSRVTEAARWVVGSTGPARVLRVMTAAALLILAGYDQAYHALAVAGQGLTEKQRAVRMNAFDLVGQMNLAQAAMQAGNNSIAMEAWKRAADLSQVDAAPRSSLLKYMVDHKRYQEAYALSSSWVKRWPADSQLMLDHGMLADMLHEDQEAITSFQHVLSRDPSIYAAHLYLADVLDRSNRTTEAVPHYLAYLSAIVRGGGEKRPPAETVIPAVVRLADAQARTSHLADAARSYHLAATMAERQGDQKLTAFATAKEAELQNALHQPVIAVELYRRALRLDAQVGDAQGEAVDWVHYSDALRSAGHPPIHGYACLLKAQQLLQSLPASPVREEVHKRLQRMEAEDHAGVASARKNLQKALAEVLPTV